MKEFRYTLARYGQQYLKKMRCPSCGKVGRFTPYFDNVNNSLCDEKFGRCDRIEGCGYHERPYHGHVGPRYDAPAPPPPLPEMIIPESVVKATTERDYTKNSLITYFMDYFPRHEIYYAASHYMIGTANNGACIYWQVDKAGRCKAGKIINYDENGHRVKTGAPVIWVHKAMPNLIEGKELKQCIFGEHLLNLSDESQPIGIVESEKTAFVMSIIEPSIVWLAVGGANNILATGCPATLYKRNVTLFPDSGMYWYWSKFAQQLGYKISQWADSVQCEKGDDILDVWLKIKNTTFLKT